MKIKERRSNDINENEISAIECLKRFDNDVEETTENKVTLSFAEQILQKHRNCRNTSKYLDTRLIILTSNVCERLFSTAEYTLRDRRKRIAPINLEQQMFLHMN